MQDCQITVIYKGASGQQRYMKS
ncbi:MAG TPA: hypothetical protein VJ863_04130 [Sphaerochaeta sp.]|nr:hypothetical protein [Sphaerochaeta sp.]